MYLFLYNNKFIFITKFCPNYFCFLSKFSFFSIQIIYFLSKKSILNYKHLPMFEDIRSRSDTNKFYSFTLQTVILHRSDADKDGVEPASGFNIQNF